MAEFTYQAVRRDGSKAEGRITAKDRAEAMRHLSARGMQAFQILPADAAAKAASAAVASKSGSEKPKTKTKEKSKSARSSTPGGKARLRQSQVIMFTEELGDLLDAGIQLEPALKLMAGRGELSAVGVVAGLAQEKVRDGMSLAKALGAVSSGFGELYCNLVAAGEVSGALPAILKRQVSFLTTLQELKGKVLTAMIYPAFLMVAGIGVSILFATFLIPRLTEMMSAPGRTIPTGIRFIMSATDFLKAWWWLLLIGLAAIIVAFRAYIQVPANRPWWDRVKLKIPLFGPLQKSRFHVQFLQTLGNLLGNGLPMINALELAEGSTSNLYFKKQLKTVTAEVAGGASLYRSLGRSVIFPQALLDLVRIGEETGQMTESITKAGVRFDRDLGRNIERISALVQPVIIILMAGIIGTMAYMMVSVIYDTIKVIQTK